MVSPIVLNFARERLALKAPGETESFRRLCTVIDQIQALKFGHSNDTALLQTDTDSHAESFVAMYGKARVRPKLHYGTIHTAPQLERDGCTLDTISNERDHKVPKSIALQKQSLQGFERFVLVRTIASELQALQDLDERPHLVGKQVWSDDFDGWVAHGMFFDGTSINTNDIVITSEGDLVEVKSCVRMDACFAVIGDEFKIISQHWNSVKANRQLKLTMVFLRKEKHTTTTTAERGDAHAYV